MYGWASSFFAMVFVLGRVLAVWLGTKDFFCFDFGDPMTVRGVIPDRPGKSTNNQERPIILHSESYSRKKVPEQHNFILELNAI
jgi:hypothetical protein